MSASPVFRLPGLTSRRKAELAAQARRLGLSPQQYVLELIENGLAIEREARSSSFDQILAPVRAGAQIGEEELDALVDQARSRHHKSARKER